MGEVGIASSSWALARSLAQQRCTVGVDKARWLQAMSSPVTVCSTARYMASVHARLCPSFTAVRDRVQFAASRLLLCKEPTNNPISYMSLGRWSSKSTEQMASLPYACLAVPETSETASNQKEGQKRACNVSDF